MRSLTNKLDRYLNAHKSSLAFWWIRCENWMEGERGPIADLGGHHDYALDFRNKTKYKLVFDDNGVVLLDYRGELGIQYNPCAIAQMGIGALSAYLRSGDQQYLRLALAQAEWLCTTIAIDEAGVGRWWYHYGNDGFPGLVAPYVSGIAQGQGVSFLLRLERLTGNPTFGKIADAAFATFYLPTTQGGIQHIDASGRLFLEEFPTEKISCVLDGFLFSIFAAHDYSVFRQDKNAGDLFNAAYDTLKQILPEFDLGFWSRTDLISRSPKMPASFYYHDLHIKQINALNDISRSGVLVETATKWRTYQRSLINRTILFFYKSAMKILYY